MHSRDNYDGPERRGPYHPQRKNVLTEADILAIAKKVVEIHVCRYDIEPKDLEDLLAFVRVFQRGAMDIKGATRSLLIKKVIPRVIIGALLTVLADYLGLLRPVLNMALKVMKGGG